MSRAQARYRGGVEMPTVRYTTIDGEIVAEKRGGVRKTYVPDPLGSTVALLDSHQQKTDTFSFWPYGESAGRTGATPTAFRFVGVLGYYGVSPAAYYVRARHICVEHGARFGSRDPLGNETGINLYRYAHDNPLTNVDPSGPKSFCSSKCQYHCKNGISDYITGNGEANNETVACKRTKKDANNRCPRDCHVRHCQPCKCVTRRDLPSPPCRRDNGEVVEDPWSQEIINLILHFLF